MSMVAAPPKPEKLIVRDDSATSYLMDTAKFEHCYRIATTMARGSLLPMHLLQDSRKNELAPDQIVGNCFRLVNQALRWGMDPFALPDETYVVSGKLGYQGKLIAAVINSRAGLKRPLGTIYNSGKGDDLAAVVYGSFEEIPKAAWPVLKKLAAGDEGTTYTDLLEMGVMCIRISVGQSKTGQQMWTKDPHQKLWYSGATKWARRYAPEILLGVLTDDDVDRMTVNQPSTTTVSEMTAMLTDGPKKTADQVELAEAIEAVEAAQSEAEANQIYNRYVDHLAGPDVDTFFHAHAAVVKSIKVGGEITPWDEPAIKAQFAACVTEMEATALASRLLELYQDHAVDIDLMESTTKDALREAKPKKK